jgi:hypothetical protein
MWYAIIYQTGCHCVRCTAAGDPRRRLSHAGYSCPNRAVAFVSGFKAPSVARDTFATLGSGF